jgi:hypothetical protein
LGVANPDGVARFIPGFFSSRLDSFCALGLPLRQFYHFVSARTQPAHFHFLACRNRLGAGDLGIVIVSGR